MQNLHRRQIRFRLPLDDGKVERQALLESLFQTRLRRLNPIAAPAGCGRQTRSKYILYN